MKHKLLMTLLTALGLSLSGAGHALLIMMPDGAKTDAQVVDNKLMLQDVTGKLTLARDGTYRTDSGKAIVVQGGIITTQGGKEPPAGNAKGGAVGPMYNAPGSPNAPIVGTKPTAPAPGVTNVKFVKCPLAKARTEVVSKLPAGWWQTPYEGPLVGTRVETIGGEKTLVCEYQAYTTRASVMSKVPPAMTCDAVSAGFNCR